jgi:hypothetical protein
MATKTAAKPKNVVSPAQGTAPTLDDFPEAEIVGGAVILDGKNMGTLMVSGEIELSPHGTAYLAEAQAPAPLSTPEPTEVPDPIPPGVLDPADHEPVKSTAKREVRRRKQNEAVVEAMNAPSAEEEANFKAADDAMAEGEDLPPPEQPLR